MVENTVIKTFKRKKTGIDNGAATKAESTIMDDGIHAVVEMIENDLKDHTTI